MRLKNLIPTFLFSLPLFCSSVDARRRHREAGRHLALHEREVVSQRQYRPQRISSRDLIDICINLDAVVDGNPLLEELFVGLHLCLCLKDLDIFLDTYVGLDILGLRALVEAELKTFFKSQPACDPLPAHAHRACTTEDPCSCTCDSGYIKSGGECVCPPPNSVCNGVCGHFPHGCGGRPSSLPRSLKKRAAQELTFADAQAYCGDKRVCGVPGDSDRAFECIDIKTSDDSCGACLYAHPWSQNSVTVGGQDCSTVSSPHALSHRCEDGQCVANECAKGYIAGTGGCVPSSRIIPRVALGAPVPVVLPSSATRIDSDTATHVTPDAPLASSTTDLSLSSTIGSLDNLSNSGTLSSLTSPSSLKELTDLGSLSDLSGASSTVSTVLSNRDQDCGCNNDGSGSSQDHPPPPPPPPSTSCPTSGSSSASGTYGDLINGLLGSLGLRKRSQDHCESSTPPPPHSATPSSSSSSSNDAGSPAPSSGSSAGSDIVADLTPLADADVNLGPGLDGATTGTAAGLGLGKLIHPGHLIDSKRDEDCNCEDGHNSTSTVSSTWTGPSSTPSAGTASGSPSSSAGSSSPSGSVSTCSPGSSPAFSSGSSTGSDIVADLSPLASADADLGLGLNSAVTGTAEGLGLGGIIHSGHLVNGKREEDCDGNGSGSSSHYTTIPVTPSSSSLSRTSWPSPTSLPSSSAGDEPCPDDPSAVPNPSGTAGDDLVVDLSPLAKADVNLGPGLDGAIAGLAGGLGLGPIVHLGHLVNEKREEDCDCEDGHGSTSTSTGSFTTWTPPSATTSPSAGSGSTSSGSSCPSGSGSNPHPGSSSGSDIVADLSPLASVDVNLGPGLDSAVTGATEGLGLGGIIHSGHLVNGKRDEDCDGNGSGFGSHSMSSSPSPTPQSSSSTIWPSPTHSSSSSEGDEPCPDDSDSSAVPKPSGSGSSTGDDLVVDLLPLTEADVNLGTGLDEAVAGLAGGVGLGPIIHLGHLVSAKRDQDCDCEDGSGSSSSYHPPPPSPSTPSTGAGSESTSTCPSGPKSVSAQSPGSSSGSDIVADLSPLAKADVNLGPGLNSATTGTAQGLGLGEVIYPGHYVNGKREDCDGNGLSGSSSSPPPPPPSSSGDEPCPDDSGPVPSTGSGNSSGNDIVVDLSPLAEADVDLGPGLNSATTGLAKGLGVGQLIYPGHLGKR